MVAGSDFFQRFMSAQYIFHSSILLSPMITYHVWKNVFWPSYSYAIYMDHASQGLRKVDFPIYVLVIIRNPNIKMMRKTLGKTIS